MEKVLQANTLKRGLFSMSEDFLDQKNKKQEGFSDEYRDEGTDLATVESQRNDLIAEEFPEGPYGSSLPTESLGKSTPWRKDQRPSNRFSYENRELHEGLQRNYPGDHETHDESANE